MERRANTFMTYLISLVWMLSLFVDYGMEQRAGRERKTCILRVKTEPKTSFRLIASSMELTASAPHQFELPAEQRIYLMVMAQGFKPACTNLILPADGVQTWKLNLEQPSPFKPGMRWENSLGMKFVPAPSTKVYFCIWETRTQDYLLYKYSTASGSGWARLSFNPKLDYPADYVNWHSAKSFCEWLTEKERAEGLISPDQKYRLPADLEWSTAAGLKNESGPTPAERDENVKDIYPWGFAWPPPDRAGNYDDFSSGKIAGFSDGFANASPVGSFKSNQFGIYDMGGNVWEWCEDWYNPAQQCRVMRGGSWRSNARSFLLTSSRYAMPPDEQKIHIGFRVVLEIDSASSAP